MRDRERGQTESSSAGQRPTDSSDDEREVRFVVTVTADPDVLTARFQAPLVAAIERLSEQRGVRSVALDEPHGGFRVDLREDGPDRWRGLGDRWRADGEGAGEGEGGGTYR